MPILARTLLGAPPSGDHLANTVAATKANKEPDDEPNQDVDAVHVPTPHTPVCRSAFLGEFAFLDVRECLTNPVAHQRYCDAAPWGLAEIGHVEPNQAAACQDRPD